MNTPAATTGRASPRAVLLWTLGVSVLVTPASLLGLLDHDVYALETENWASQARGQDIGNLLAVAVLWTSGVAHARGSHRAGLVWLGTMTYFAYAYVVYAMAVHLNRMFLVYVAALGLSVYAAALSSRRLAAAHARLPRPARSWWAGGTSVGIGVLFGLLWLSEVVPATLSGEVPGSVVEAGLPVNPIHVLDLALVLPAFITAGVLALRARPTGELLVGPLLVFSVLTGSSIVAAMVLMAAAGIGGAVPPLVLVSLVVVLSAAAAHHHLRQYPGR